MIGNLLNKLKKPEQGNGKVISLLNQKGGVGKTTMAFNAAHALANNGHSVLCIDMDPQANLSLLFGIDSSDLEYNVYNLLINSVRELKALHSPVLFSDVIKPSGTNSNIDILPAGQELSGFELSIAGISSPRQMILKKFIDKNQLKNSYDYIVIDGPPTLGLLVVNILCASQGVLVPFQPDQFSRKGLSHFHTIIEDVEDMGITETPKIIGYIPNLVDARRKQAGEDFDKIRQDLDLGSSRIFEPFNNKVQLVKSSAQRKSVFDFQSKEFQELQGQFNSIANAIDEELSGSTH
jgi:chromosome partitioning protein